MMAHCNHYGRSDPWLSHHQAYHNHLYNHMGSCPPQALPRIINQVPLIDPSQFYSVPYQNLPQIVQPQPSIQLPAIRNSRKSRDKSLLSQVSTSTSKNKKRLTVKTGEDLAPVQIRSKGSFQKVPVTVINNQPSQLEVDQVIVFDDEGIMELNKLIRAPCKCRCCMTERRRKRFGQDLLSIDDHCDCGSCYHHQKPYQHTNYHEVINSYDEVVANDESEEESSDSDSGGRRGEEVITTRRKKHKKKHKHKKKKRK